MNTIYIVTYDVKNYLVSEEKNVLKETKRETLNFVIDIAKRNDCQLNKIIEVNTKTLEVKDLNIVFTDKQFNLVENKGGD